MSIRPNDPANFTPGRGDYKDLSPFRFWCQKVLPLVYDDSLSYYELLCKVVDYLNKTMEDVTVLDGDVTGLHDAYVELQDYVNGYFSTLDVQVEIDNKLDNMATSGRLSQLLEPFIPGLVTGWLDENIGPTTPPIDKSLSIEGAGADAKTVGDIKDDLSSLVGIWTRGKAYDTPSSVSTIQPSETTDVPTFSCTAMSVVPGDKLILTGVGGSGSKLWVWITSDGTIIDRAGSSVSLTNAELEAPSEAAWLLCSVRTEYQHSLEKVTPTFDKIDKNKVLSEISVVDKVGFITSDDGSIYLDLLSRLKQFTGKSMGNSLFQTTTIFDYIDKATDTATGNLYESVRIRDIYGNQTLTILVDFDPVPYLSANMAFGYKADGTPDQRYNASNVVDGEMVLGPDTYYLVFQTYDTLHIRFYSQIGSYKTDFHVGAGQEYATLHECLVALKDNDMPKTIHIYGSSYGDTYDILSEMGGQTFLDGLSASDNWYDVCDIIPPNTHVIGHGNVIIDLTIPSGTPSDIAVLLSPINLQKSASIENLTIQCSGGRYCIHGEGSHFTENDNAVWKIHNCKIHKTNNLSGTPNAIGIGVNNGVLLEITDSVITNDGNTGLLVHDQQVAAGSFPYSPRILVSNCAIDVAYYPCVWSSTHSQTTSGAMIEATVINCSVNNKFMRKIGAGNSDVFKVTYINTPHRTQNQATLENIIEDINIGGVEVDDTLTRSGMAADAMVTGDQITQLKDDLNDTWDVLTEKYTSYVVGNVNMETGIPNYNVTKSVLAEGLNPDEVTKVYIPEGYQTYLFCYGDDYITPRINLGKNGINLTGEELKSRCNEGTDKISITVYNLSMSDNFTVEEFIATGAYISQLIEVHQLVERIEKLENESQVTKDVERLKYNDKYYASGVIRRCYNPYKLGGNSLLVGQLHCHDLGWNSNNTGPEFYDTSSHIETAQNYKDAGFDFLTITNYSYFPLTHIDDTDMPSGLTWLCDSAEVPFYGGTDEDGFNEKIKHIIELNINDLDGQKDFIPLKDLPVTEKQSGTIISIAHPYWTSTYVSPESIAKIEGGIRFVEVWDGIIEYHRERGDTVSGFDYVTYPTGKGSDYAFEQMLDMGLVTWGIAISDVHSGLKTNGIFKRGCVKVYSDANNRFSILKNLCSGNFYASSNVDTSIVSVSFENGVYRIETGSNSAVTRFLKENGTVVKEVTGNIAEYRFNGSEKYVRAVVLFDTGNLDYQNVPIYEKVWTQPVINIFKPDYDNYFDYDLT